MKACLYMKILLQSRKRGSINERLHLFAKDEKGYPFFINIAVTQNDLTRVLNFKI